MGRESWLSLARDVLLIGAGLFCLAYLRANGIAAPALFDVNMVLIGAPGLLNLPGLASLRRP